jgi:hypothetical protein
MTNRGRWESEFDEQAYQDCRACMDACAYLDDMGRPSATLTPADIPVRVPPGWVAGPGSMAEPEESGADWAFHGD